MIRLTVDQLHQLQQDIQRAGEINASVLPENAMPSFRLAVAWAKGPSGMPLYLSVWNSYKSWDAAFDLDGESGYTKPDTSEEYTHAYPVENMPPPNFAVIAHSVTGRLSASEENQVGYGVSHGE